VAEKVFHKTPNLLNVVSCEINKVGALVDVKLELLERARQKFQPPEV
jgi:hypothetical protein